MEYLKLVLERKNKQIEYLQNRCFVLSRGAMCFCCDMECKNRRHEFRGDENGQ